MGSPPSQWLSLVAGDLINRTFVRSPLRSKLIIYDCLCSTFITREGRGQRQHNRTQEDRERESGGGIGRRWRAAPALPLSLSPLLSLHRQVHTKVVHGRGCCGRTAVTAPMLGSEYWGGRRGRVGCRLLPLSNL